MCQLVRLGLLRWCRQEQRIVDSLPQTQGCRNVPAKIRNHNLLISNNAILSDQSAMGRQRDVDDAICDPKCGGLLVKNEWSVRSVAKGYSPFLGARIGIICHGGPSRYCFPPYRKPAPPPNFPRMNSANGD